MGSCCIWRNTPLCQRRLCHNIPQLWARVFTIEEEQAELEKGSLSEGGGKKQATGYGSDNWVQNATQLGQSVDDGHCLHN